MILLAGLRFGRANLPENTTNPLCTLGSSPFIKTQFVDVIPACCFAPDDFLLGGLEFHKADRALIFNGFSIAGDVVVRVGRLVAEGGALVDFAEFLSWERRLVFCLDAFEGSHSLLIRMPVGIEDAPGLLGRLLGLGRP